MSEEKNLSGIKQIDAIYYTGRCPTCLNPTELHPNQKRSSFCFVGTEKNDSFDYELCPDCAEMMRNFFFITMERRRTTKNITPISASLMRFIDSLPSPYRETLLKGLQDAEKKKEFNEEPPKK
jgi:hypothetical protein